MYWQCHLEIIIKPKSRICCVSPHKTVLPLISAQADSHPEAGTTTAPGDIRYSQAINPNFITPNPIIIVVKPAVDKLKLKFYFPNHCGICHRTDHLAWRKYRQYILATVESGRCRGKIMWINTVSAPQIVVHNITRNNNIFIYIFIIFLSVRHSVQDHPHWGANKRDLLQGGGGASALNPPFAFVVQCRMKITMKT